MRVASGMIRDRMATAAPAASQEGNSSPSRDIAAGTAQAVRTTAAKAQNLGRASRRFGESLWGPLVHAGSVLWLEVTGVFFGIFAAFFAQNAWKLRASRVFGPEHGHFLLFSGLTLLFTWFTVGSFVRAALRERKRRNRG